MPRASADSCCNRRSGTTLLSRRELIDGQAQALATDEQRESRVARASLLLIVEAVAQRPFDRRTGFAVGEAVAERANSAALSHRSAASWRRRTGSSHHRLTHRIGGLCATASVRSERRCLSSATLAWTGEGRRGLLVRTTPAAVSRGRERAVVAFSLCRRSGFSGRGGGLLLFEGGGPAAEEVERFVGFGAGLGGEGQEV